MSATPLKLVVNTPEGVAQPARQVGRYTIVSELGKGAMGVVYRAEDPLIQRTVALKLLAVEFDGWDGDKARASLLREARASGRLNHPNIVTVYDVGDDLDGLYIAMEYVPGITVRETLDSGVVLPLRRALDVAMLVARGLDYAHRHGVIHRDIKPANIMLARDGVVKIMDFSIAWADTGKTQAESMMGSPRYMAPEQIVLGQADARTDVYALGITLYEMLTGRTPFEHGSIPEVMHKIIHVVPEPPSRYNPEVTPALDAIVLKALAKDPEERFPRAKEFGRALLEQRRLMREQRAAEQLSSSTQAAYTAGRTSRSRTSSGTAAEVAEVERTQRRAARRQARLAAQQSATQGDGWLGAVRAWQPTRMTGVQWVGVAALVAAVAVGMNLAQDDPMQPASLRGPLPDSATELARLAEQPTAAVVAPQVLVPVRHAEAEAVGSLQQAALDAQPPAAGAADEALLSTRLASAEAIEAAQTDPMPVEPAPVPATLPSSEPAPTSAAQVTVREARPAVPKPVSTSGNAAAGAPAQVSLAVMPWGEVFVNGRSYGVTPPMRTLELPAGRYRIEIRNAGFPAHTQRLSVEAGGTYRINHRFRE